MFRLANKREHTHCAYVPLDGGEIAAVIVAGGFLYVMAWAIGKSRMFRPHVLLCVSLCGSFVISFVVLFLSSLFYWLIFGHEIWSN